MEVVILSDVCCAPNRSASDESVEKNVYEALKQLNSSAEIRTVCSTAALKGYALPQQQGEINTLFQRYGVKFVPAILVNGEFVFMGNVPSVDQIKAKIEQMISQPD